MIKELDVSEIYKLELIAEEFFSLADRPGKFDMDIFKRNWTLFYELGIGTIFVLADDKTDKIYGAIGCVKIPDLMTDTLIAAEMFWFVSAGKRGAGMKLFDRFEKWAKEAGCHTMKMVHMSNIMTDFLHSIYKRRGYREVEVAYEKEVR